MWFTCISAPTLYDWHVELSFVAIIIVYLILSCSSKQSTAWMTCSSRADPVHAAHCHPRRRHPRLPVHGQARAVLLLDSVHSSAVASVLPVQVVVHHLVHCLREYPPLGTALLFIASPVYASSAAFNKRKMFSASFGHHEKETFVMFIHLCNWFVDVGK